MVCQNGWAVVKHDRYYWLMLAGRHLPQRIMLRLMPRNIAFMGFFSMLTSQVTRNQGGTFELRGVTPGAYTLMAQWSDNEKG